MGSRGSGKDKLLPFPENCSPLPAGRNSWSQVKEPVDFSGYIFSCFVGYWLHDLIKAVPK